MKRKIKLYRGKTDDPYLKIPFLINRHKWKWQSIGAIITLGGGFLSPVIGVLLDVFVWFSKASYLRLPLSKISITFYILTFLLLAAGSHCLDLLEGNLLLLQIIYSLEILTSVSKPNAHK